MWPEEHRYQGGRFRAIELVPLEDWRNQLIPSTRLLDYARRMYNEELPPIPPWYH